MVSPRYKGPKIQIALVPSTVYDMRSSYFIDGKFHNLLSLKELSAILFPQALFFYNMINSRSLFTQVGNDDIFMLVGDQVNNGHFMNNYDAAIPADLRQSFNKEVEALVKHTLYEINDKYSMLETILLLSKNVVIKNESNIIYIFSDSDGQGGEDDLSIIKSGEVEKLDYYYDNLHNLIHKLIDIAGVDNIVCTDLYKLYVQLTIKRTFRKYGSEHICK